MTRKDYEILAAVMKQTRPVDLPGDVTLAKSMWSYILVDMCEAFRKVNPDFDADKFIRACNAS